MTILGGQFCNYDSACIDLYGNSVLLLDEDLPVLCTLSTLDSGIIGTHSYSVSFT